MNENINMKIIIFIEVKWTNLIIFKCELYKTNMKCISFMQYPQNIKEVKWSLKMQEKLVFHFMSGNEIAQILTQMHKLAYRVDTRE